MDNLIELSGKYLSNGDEAPLQVVIQTPKQDDLSGDYYCQVTSQQLFSRTMKVYGISRSQAISLAVMLVKDALISKMVTKEDMAYDVEREDESITLQPLFHPQDGSNRIPTGRYIVMCENGTRLLEASYEDGVLHGPYVSYWPNGIVSSEEHKEGKTDDKWHYYNSDGTIHAVIQFQNGNESDSSLYVYDEDGTLCDVIR